MFVDQSGYLSSQAYFEKLIPSKVGRKALLSSLLHIITLASKKEKGKKQAKFSLLS